MLIARAVFPTYRITALNRQSTSWRVEAVVKPQRWQEWEDVLRQQGSDGREASVDLPVAERRVTMHTFLGCVTIPLDRCLGLSPVPHA